jgi:hypothetical protein
MMGSLRSAAASNQRMSNPIVNSNASTIRPYFSVLEKVKERFNIPMKHFQSFAEVGGQNYQSQLPEAYRLHGNSAMSFTASINNNAIDLHNWHEMESTVHSQFGTVDNPVLVFTSDSSWRIVICMGPGIEDDSHSHEKIFYMVREGPINRCQHCGQCFKLVRLKDEYSEQQDYYTMMFSTLSHFDVQEEDFNISLTSLFGDRPSTSFQSLPSTNVYIQVNSDDADRILVDPAYKLERTKEAYEKLHAIHSAFHEVDKQMAELRTVLPIAYGRDNYDAWYNIELAVRKFDRIFNKVEKFKARKFSDPVNHKRREQRMQERMKKRWTDNYTYFLGALTEEEQQYKDYFESDIEEDPEDEYIESLRDKADMAATGEFDPKLYDFIDTALHEEAHENYEDIIEDKIFKYKYRQNADPPHIYRAREGRVHDRFMDRLAKRDESVHRDLSELYLQDEKYRSVPALLLEPEKFGDIAAEGLSGYRKWMVEEAIQQYRDYYEDDEEEQRFFEYFGNITERDQIRFLEIFNDYSVSRTDKSGYVMIPKREFNPELSTFSNFALDLIDFKDRVKPMAADIARLDVTKRYQPKTYKQVMEEHDVKINGLAGRQAKLTDADGNSS